MRAGLLLLEISLLGCQAPEPPALIQQTSGSMQTIEDAYVARQVSIRNERRIFALEDSLADYRVRIVALEKQMEDLRVDTRVAKELASR